MSLYHDILDKVTNQNLISLECGCQKITYYELNKKCSELGDMFKKIGIKEKMKVLLKYENPYDFSILLLALLSIDAIPIPVSCKSTLENIQIIISKYKINYFISDTDSLSNMVNLNSLYFVDFNNEIDSSLSNVALILLTSGTTNFPKAIMLSRGNIFSNIQAISKYLKLGTNDNILLIKDLSHSSSIIGELFVGLFNSCKIVMTESRVLMPKTVLNLVENKRITVLFAIPTILKNLMAFSKFDSYDVSSLRIINFYGAPMSSNDILKLVEVFPDCNLIYSYGQTEASPRVSYIEKKDLVNKPASSGKAISNVTISIQNDEGEKAKPFEKGEIIVDGPNVMLGYYMDKDKTNKTIVDSKLHTGDLGYFDEEGFLYVSGRKDNMVIIGGKNIYPEEIENVLLGIGIIQEVIIIPQKTDNDRISLVAYVALKDNSEFNYNEIINYCKQKLEDYKVPNKIIRISSLFKTNNGKIIRDPNLYKLIK